jgi:hypothetical protein
MTLQTLKFILYVLPQRGAYFKVMPSDCQLHVLLLRFVTFTLAA